MEQRLDGNIVVKRVAIESQLDSFTKGILQTARRGQVIFRPAVI
jgi:hypothetical protein